jgi:hypothetical protein
MEFFLPHVYSSLRAILGAGHLPKKWGKKENIKVRLRRSRQGLIVNYGMYVS